MRKKNAFYQYHSKEFEVQINPVFNYESGKESAAATTLNVNTRGIELRGMIGKKVGFYTYVSDNQTTLPQYVRDRIDSTGSVPGEGFWKPFKTYGNDFFSARGYITFNVIKQINIQFGNDKNFIGNGYRSLILSDYSSKYLFLKLTTKVWRFQLTNLFCDMTAQVRYNNNYNPRKYVAFHHLSINLAKNLNIGVFENIVFQRQDSISGNNGFELNYLNPVIFYREEESYLGSRDKATVGLDLKWNVLKHFSFYGQFILNEFVLHEITAQKGWWANKYAWQIGLKYIDAFGLRNVDIQLENNFVRPFTYSDKYSGTSSSNYGLPFAHPLGANFNELIGIVRYQPMPKLTFTGKLIYYVYGADKPGTNYGGDILKSYLTRTQEYGNLVGQGNRTTVVFADLVASYMLFHNFFLDGHITLRKQSDDYGTASTTLGTFGLRWNIARRVNEY